MPTLQSQLSTWRTTNQPSGANRNLMSILTIDDKLYDIKDPALGYIAEQIENRLNSIETSTIRESELTKSNDAAKFATSVTQGTDGQISVTYGTIRDSALEDSAVAHQFITEVDQTIDGVVSINRSAVYDDDIELKAATKTLLDLTGTKYVSDAIAALKTYTDTEVANLAGQDWSENARKVQEIIAELENSDNGNAWATAIDKLAGLGVKTAAVYYTQEECDEYNTANSLQSGDEGFRTTSDIKTPAVYNTVKDYVDAAVAAAASDATAGIQGIQARIDGLDGVQTANITVVNNEDTVSTGHHIGVKITEVDGLITNVTLLESDIASAAVVEENERITAAALVDLDTRKANKAAIGTASIHDWVSTYDSTNENLTWTNTSTTVYVPVSGQTL